MNRKRFPDPRQASPEGLVAVGGDLAPETLLEAYTSGIFPWPQPEMPLLWFSPDPRGVIDFEDLHIPESLKKWDRKNSHWEYTLNSAFSQVIECCARQPRPGQDGTWILPVMKKAYEHFFDQGHVLCLECWEHGELVGGIYGVLFMSQNGTLIFSGESMFHLKDNASKMCLWKMIQHLQKQGHKWMDIQMITDVTEAMGGKYISRDEFLKRIGV